MKNIICLILSILTFSTITAQTMKTAFINGKIYTVNENQPLAEAVVVELNRIVFVGSNEDAKGFIDHSTNLVDLKGKLMLPGFIDNHVHFITGGFYLLGIDLRPANSTSEFKQILKKYLRLKILKLKL